MPLYSESSPINPSGSFTKKKDNYWYGLITTIQHLYSLNNLYDLNIKKWKKNSLFEEFYPFTEENLTRNHISGDLCPAEKGEGQLTSSTPFSIIFAFFSTFFLSRTTSISTLKRVTYIAIVRMFFLYIYSLQKGCVHFSMERYIYIYIIDYMFELCCTLLIWTLER